VKLSDAKIKAAKPTEKVHKLFDGGGLHIRVEPRGTKTWRLKYRFGNKEKLLALGVYPAVPLQAARKLRDAARELLAATPPVDPGAKRAEDRAAAGGDSFASVAEAFVIRRMVNAKRKLAKRTISKARGQLRRYVNPVIGDKPIAEVTDTDLLEILGHIESLDKIETAYKTRELIGRIFRYAKAQKLCPHNIVADLEREALPGRPTENHHAAILERPKLGELLRAIEGYRGQPASRAALSLLPHVVLRSAELRGAKWPEINFKSATWTVPASRMKPVKGVREEHIVPLSKQVLAILKELKTITGNGEYIFPAIGPKARPISENTLGAGLAALGYSSDQQTAHGFRAIFRTIAAEDLEIRVDWLDMQLSHKVKDPNGRAYNRASFLPQRAKVMAQWSDYLDKLRATT
jgi:integrase